MKRFVVAFLMVGLASAASADPRPWSFTYDTYSEGKGNWEVEQWITWKGHRDDESGYNRWEFREEIEFGITDYFDLGLYLPNWSYEDSNSRQGTKFDSVGIEGIVYLSKPSDFIGVGLYGEVKIGESGREYEFEQKLMLHKDIGPWSFAYNLIIETEVEREDGENEVEGVLGHALAAAYSVNKNWRLGGELLIESIYADWNEYEKTVVYLGPSINYVGNGIPGTQANWWVTVTPTFQLTDEGDEPDFVFRAIMGLEF